MMDQRIFMNFTCSNFYIYTMYISSSIISTTLFNYTIILNNQLSSLSNTYIGAYHLHLLFARNLCRGAGNQVDPRQRSWYCNYLWREKKLQQYTVDNQSLNWPMPQYKISKLVIISVWCRPIHWCSHHCILPFLFLPLSGGLCEVELWPATWWSGTGFIVT